MHLARFTVVPLLFALSLVAPACSGKAPNENGALDIATSEQALCVAPPACTLTSPSACNGGLWPGGTIYYQFVPGATTAGKNMARQAMRDWESIAAHTISFVETSSASPRVSVTPEGGGVSNSYADCIGGGSCVSQFGWSNVYHELGHVIGFRHHFQRFDRERYVRVASQQHQTCPGGPLQPNDCSDPFNEAQCDNASTTSGLGPYDYQSTMQYAVTHPDITRWEGSPIVPGTACNQCPLPPLPPQCSDTDCTGTHCNGLAGYICPTCSTCNKTQPTGLPSQGDGAAVAEMYTKQGAPSWQNFARTLNDDGTKAPYANTLAPGVTIVGSPTVESWGGASLGIYVRGTDQHIYQKWKILNGGSFTWSAWTDRGCCLNSDPSVVSWASGRSDLVARGLDSAIYISTYDGSRSSNWTGFGTLGAPSGGAASAPSITSWGPNRLDLFVRGTDDKLYVKSCTANCYGNTGTWTGWAAFPGGTFRGKPAAVSRGNGLNDIFVHAMDDTLWATWYHSAGMGSWYNVKSASAGTLRWDPNCPDCSSPSAGSRGTNSIDVYVRGQDDKTWITTWNGGSTWSGYGTVGGVLRASPGTVSRVRDANRLDVLVIMNEETTSGTSTPATWWKVYQ